jgi:glycosyltransferase involved in cell wall biosynthesis
VGVGLVEAGYEVTAVCSRRSYTDPSRTYPGREVRDGVHIRRTWSTGFGRSSELGRLIDYATFLIGAAVALVFSRRPDVLISLSTPPMVAGLGWALARLRGARSIYWVMDVYPDLAYELGVLPAGSLSGRLLDRVSRFLVRRSDRVVVLGETMAARLRGAREESPIVVHNWADGESIRPRPVVESSLRREWNWGDRFVVLYSGNMGLAHEFETILDAAAKLSDRSEILFAFIGGGPRRAEVEAAVAERGLTHVEFRPYVPREKLADSLIAGDLHLVTLRDGLAGLLVPSKIYGILAAGRTTLYVGPDEGEIAEIVRSGPSGTRVAVGDASALAAAILGYLEDPQNRETHGRNARSQFDRCFTRPRAIAAFKSILEGL